jgi:hypothetical protein
VRLICRRIRFRRLSWSTLASLPLCQGRTPRYALSGSNSRFQIQRFSAFW